jgi:uncharacterized OB-fold protein
MNYREEYIKVYCKHCGADQKIKIVRFQNDGEVRGASRCWHCKKTFAWTKQWKSWELI